MKLDEVIETAPYIGTEWTNNALYYLKEYKNKQNVGTMMFALHNTNKTVCDDCWLSREMAGEGFKQIYKKYIEEENPPLTWDELKTMEGKPVWVELLKSSRKAWGLNDGIFLDALLGHETVTIKVLHDLWHLDKAQIGKTWQAYRKERS